MTHSFPSIRVPHSFILAYPGQAGLEALTDRRNHPDGLPVAKQVTLNPSLLDMKFCPFRRSFVRHLFNTSGCAPGDARGIARGSQRLPVASGGYENYLI